MDLDWWMGEYRNICRELGLSPQEDYRARDIASQLIGDKPQPLGKLESIVRNHRVVVLGAGPSLENEIDAADLRGKTIITSDGATSCLLERGVFPDVVVSDLDGKLEDLLIANRLGAIMVIHAHGDNISSLRLFLPKFKNVVVTTQVEPVKNVQNFFGFTDGDRAVFLAYNLGASSIELVGFDFGDVVGKYSDPKNPTNHPASERKAKKLVIAKRLIGNIIKEKR